MKVILVEPEIPPNTGSIARMCAGMKIPLHLIEPLGFSLENRYLKRAGLDYWPFVDLTVHKSWDEYLAKYPDEKRWFCTKKSTNTYTKVKFGKNDALVFGCETKGLSDEILADHNEELIGIPIIGEIRSYNLSNAVSIVLFEALRQVEPELFS